MKRMHNMDWELIMAVLGGIVLLGNVGKVIYSWIAPALRVKKKVEDLEAHTKKDYETLQKIETSIETIEKNLRLNMVSQVSILNHMIDSNNIEQMKKTRDQIQERLADPEG